MHKLQDVACATRCDRRGYGKSDGHGRRAEGAGFGIARRVNTNINGGWANRIGEQAIGK